MTDLPGWLVAIIENGIELLVGIVIAGGVLQRLLRFFTDRPGQAPRPPAREVTPQPRGAGLGVPGRKEPGREVRREGPYSGREGEYPAWAEPEGAAAGAFSSPPAGEVPGRVAGPAPAPAWIPPPGSPPRPAGGPQAGGPEQPSIQEAPQPGQRLRRRSPGRPQEWTGWPWMGEATPWGELMRQLGELLGDFGEWSDAPQVPPRPQPGEQDRRQPAQPPVSPAGTREPASPAAGEPAPVARAPSGEGVSGTEGTAGPDEGWSVEGQRRPRAAGFEPAQAGHGVPGAAYARRSVPRLQPAATLSAADIRTAWQWAEILGAPRSVRPWRPMGRQPPRP